MEIVMKHIEFVVIEVQMLMLTAQSDTFQINKNDVETFFCALQGFQIEKKLKYLMNRNFKSQFQFHRWNFNSMQCYSEIFLWFLSSYES